MSEWQPIETAPKDRVIYLWVPEIPEAWTEGPWRGGWSWVNEEWCLHLPFSVNNKAAITKAVPQPTHWMPLPEKPK